MTPLRAGVALSHASFCKTRNSMRRPWSIAWQASPRLMKDLLIYGVGPQSGCTIGTLALHRLALQEGPDHDLCPKLESLTLEPGVAPDGALAQLLSLKVPPSTCVEKIVPLSGVRGVRISFLKARVPSMAEAREEVLRMIKKLKKTGMDVELVD